MAYRDGRIFRGIGGAIMDSELVNLYGETVANLIHLERTAPTPELARDYHNRWVSTLKARQVERGQRTRDNYKNMWG